LLEEHGIRPAIVSWLTHDLFTLSALRAFFLHTFLSISLSRAIDFGGITGWHRTCGTR
jgi:hypothetical protein